MMVGGCGIPEQGLTLNFCINIMAITCNLNMSFTETNLILCFASEVRNLSVGQVVDGQLMDVALLPLLPARQVIQVVAHFNFLPARKIKPFYLKRTLKSV